MHPTAVGKELFKGARQVWKLEAPRRDDPKVFARLGKVKLAETLREAKKDWKATRSTYYSWKRKLEKKGLRGLKPKPKRPKRVRQKVHWTPRAMERIAAFRKDNPTWGRWPIWFTLVKEGHQVSERTVGWIPVHLEGLGRIESVAGFLARERRGKARRKARRPYATRKPRDYEAEEPGDLVQIDTLQVVLEDGERVWQFTGVDLVSRYRFGSIHSRATAGLAARFLEAAHGPGRMGAHGVYGPKKGGSQSRMY